MNHLFLTLVATLFAANLAMADIAPPKRKYRPLKPVPTTAPVEAPSADVPPLTRDRDIAPPKEKKANPQPVEKEVVIETGNKNMIFGLAAGVLVLGFGSFMVLRVRRNESDSE